jgi:hypothetical protein
MRIAFLRKTSVVYRIATAQVYWSRPKSIAESDGIQQPVALLPESGETSMTEESKFALLFAAAILTARKLAEQEDPDQLSPKNVETAIRHAAYILGEIDKKRPSKAPFAHCAGRLSNTTPVI